MLFRSYDLDDNTHMLSIVAWDKGFTYLKPKKAVGLDVSKIAKNVMKKVNPELKLGVDDYLNIAMTGLGRFKYGKAIEDNHSEKLAARGEQVVLDKAFDLVAKTSYSRLLVDTNEDIEQVFSDYPELYDQLSEGEMDVTADGMLELVMAALGSIDPNGPNKWLLDYMDGKGLPEGKIPQIVFDQTTPKETGK